ncbi:MAG: ABC-F family ATP-binding cassette domain-containing protein [Mycoplasma sp.]|nr:ABC-F family ATP-binding cassette domain-containing protein [Mycoplasma sp.]
MLEIINLTKRFSDKKLFENVNLKFIAGYTYGVIGANGAGKSTLLKILSKQEEATSGNIVLQKDKRISILEQDQNKYNNFNVTDVVIMGNKKLFDLNQEKNNIYNNPDASEKDYEKAALLEEQYGAMGGWVAENDAQTLLAELNIDPSLWNASLSQLKSEDKVKVLLAKAIFGNPDVLIMDEPTNFLNLKTIKWLEKFLINYKNVVIIASHDIEFLDNVCTHILDVDRNQIAIYTGNYSFWKESSQLMLEMIEKQNLKKENQIAKLKTFIERFSANAKLSSQATSRKKVLAKISLDEIKPSNRRYPFIQWNINRQPGKDILIVENLSYVENQITYFENISFTLLKKDKLAIVGLNDVARTKLIQVLIGELKPTTGSIKWGVTIKHTYYPKDYDHYFQKDQTILDWISQWPLLNVESNDNKDNSDNRMRAFLGRMFFSNDSVFKNVKNTSGGEKARLMFSRMMLLESNFLIFDQPLNHLDIESIESVIKGIANYPSSVIFTTYNQTLISKCANVILDLDNKSKEFFRGTFSEFISSKI